MPTNLLENIQSALMKIRYSQSQSQSQSQRTIMEQHPTVVDPLQLGAVSKAILKPQEI